MEKQQDDAVSNAPEPAAMQGGNRVASITPQGQAMNQSVSEYDRVTAVPKSKGAQGQNWQSDAKAQNPADHGGYMNPDPDTFPDARDHAGGDPLGDGDAQYGASPLREARYAENHQATEDITVGLRRSGHHGAQARYPTTAEQKASPGGYGHDEQRLSQDLANGKS